MTGTDSSKLVLVACLGTLNFKTVIHQLGPLLRGVLEK